MIASKFSDAKAFILKQGAVPIADISRKPASSRRPVSIGRSGTMATEVWRHKQLEDKNQLATGQKLRVLMIVNTFSRFSPALVPPLAFRSADVVEALGRVGRELGSFRPLGVDQGAHRVCLAQPESVGLPARRCARLLSPSQADRQCLRQALNVRFRERTLVPESCR